MRELIPVVDLFSGPGGLAEGFAAPRRKGGRPRFKVALSVQMLEVNLPSRIADELVEQKEADRGARRIQRELNEIEAQIAAVKAGGEFWADALDWGRSRGLLTPMEAGVLEVATRIPRRLPTEKQSFKAIEVLRKLQSEGYAGRAS